MGLDHPPHSTSISGDLPIRTIKPAETPVTAETESAIPRIPSDVPKSVTFEDGPAGESPKPKPRVGVPQTKLDDEVALRAGQIMASVGTKTKHRRPKSQRGLGKPTGFEEYYADGPLTPAEHEEMRRVYNPYVSFLLLLSCSVTNNLLMLGPTRLRSEFSCPPRDLCSPEMLTSVNYRRIQEALTRYQWKRRMENDRRSIFFKYLQYGGVDASQNYGTGISPKDLKQMSNDEARQARSQTMISPERRGLEVDFEKVAKGFWCV